MISSPRRSPRSPGRGSPTFGLHPEDDVQVEQAKGVLMLLYGVGSHESLAVMVRWAHAADVAVIDIARVLIKGVCQGRVQPRDHALVRWLEHRLRDDIHPQSVDQGSGTGAQRSTEPHPADSPDAGRADDTGGGIDFCARTSRRPDVPCLTLGSRWRYTSATQAAWALNSG